MVKKRNCLQKIGNNLLEVQIAKFIEELKKPSSFNSKIKIILLSLHITYFYYKHKGKKGKLFSEELSEFEDYLKEFESTVFFDSELCPTCGINISDSIIPVSIAFVQIQFNSNKEKNLVLNKIKNSGIIVKEGDRSIQNKDDRSLLIPENKLDDIQKLLENNNEKPEI
jgi:hypothetical protein